MSVERLLDPSLVGKPVVVGGSPGQRGVVTAACYEVRAFGVRSGTSLPQAYELAPHAIYIPTRHGVYGDYAKRVREIAETYTLVSCRKSRASTRCSSTSRAARTCTASTATPITTR